MIGVIAAGAPHLFEHKAIEIELIAQASHAHPLYWEANLTIYYRLEEATRATSYAASIKPFQRTKNGREAWLPLTNQYADKDKWEYRNAFASMQVSAEHVTYQLPNEHSRIGYLLDAIQCSDAGLQAAIASIKTDQDPAAGLRNNFKAAAPRIFFRSIRYKEKRSNHAGGAADISDVTHDEADISAFGAKKGIGKTGVYLRYHPSSEYQKLTTGQKDELQEW